jgi:hypothetical protein
MTTLLRCRSAALVFALLLVPVLASAQSQCMDCGPGSDCGTTCLDGGTLSTCGAWGVCFETYHNCGYICGSGQAACDTYCYSGEWPNGYGTTCQAAGYSCSTCTPNYQQVTEFRAQWQDVKTEGWPPAPVCYLHLVRQHVYRDLNECEGSNPPVNQDCWDTIVNAFMDSTSCCDNWPNWQCEGSWPASCR